MWEPQTVPGKVLGKFGITALPGPNGPGSSSLGGANLAISAYSRYQHVLEQATNSAQPRPGHHQLRPGQPGHLERGVRDPDAPEETAASPTEMAGQLTQIIRDG
jgi:hypothetical protein